MATVIRLARGGSKKRPFYRIVVADSRMARDGRFIEKVGTYNPLLAKDNENRVSMDVEKVKEWIGKGAQPTDRIQRFLEAAGEMDKKTRNNPNKGEPGKKAKERVEEKAEKAVARKEAEEEAKKAAAEAAKEAEAAAKAAAEAPAEEAPAEETPAEEAPAEEAAAEAPAEETAAEAPAEEAATEDAPADGDAPAEDATKAG